jgi:hypothetical protein
VKYFAAIPKGTDLSVSAQAKIACFLAAAHLCMLDYLQSAQSQHNFNGEELRKHWYEQMESNASGYRTKFYEDVGTRALVVSHFSSSLFLSLISFDS